MKSLLNVLLATSLVMVLMGTGVVNAQENSDEVVADSEEESSDGYNPYSTGKFSTEIDRIMGVHEVAEETAVEEETEPFYVQFMDQYGATGIVCIITFCSAFMLWVLMLLDAIRRPKTDYPGSLPKGVWIAGIVITFIVGTFAYYAVIYRPSKKALFKS